MNYFIVLAVLLAFLKRGKNVKNYKSDIRVENVPQRAGKTTSTITSVQVSSDSPSERDSIDCVQCNTVSDLGCESPSRADLDKYLQPCDVYANKASLCRKIHLKVLQATVHMGPHERIIRSCGYETNATLKCHRVNRPTHVETTCLCNDDGCNHSSTLHQATLTWISLSITLFRLLLT